MGKKMPFIMAVYLFAGVALVGIPPLVGFQSKWALAEAAIRAGGWMGVAAVATLLMSAVLTAIYMLVPAISAYAMPLDETGLPSETCDPGWRMKLPLGILCVLMLVLAFASAPLSAFLGRVAAGIL